MKCRLAITLVALAGDLAVFGVFAFLGHVAHHETLRDPIGEIGATAAPFALGWLAGATACGAYRPLCLTRFRGLKVVALAWIPGAALALMIRSILERRIVPLGFAAVAVCFNLGLLLLWRTSLAMALRLGKDSSPV